MLFILAPWAGLICLTVTPLSKLRATIQLTLCPLARVLKTGLHAQSSTILQVLRMRPLPCAGHSDLVAPKTAACMRIMEQSAAVMGVT